MPKKILLDTDIGNDIDDAICLAWLLCNPECDLLGVTTVSGQPVERAMLSDALCKAAGKKVPIHPGTEAPLIIESKQKGAPQAEKLANHPHGTDFCKNSAIEFMRDTIYANPGEVTLLAIGPMTNVGLLFATYPKTAELLGGLMLMCGDFIRGGDALEWNAICDPHACKIVYGKRVASHRSVGINVTLQVTMSAAEVRERFTHPVLKVVADYAEVMFRSCGTVTFHDPLAAVGIFHADVMEFARGSVGVETEYGKLLGRTSFEKDGAGPCEVAASVKPELFFEHYFEAFK